ncbi:MAG: hypothetical protein J6A79_11890 [Clostridia bacterium]|nr:hypothetical protein [Clostridia bacterium]
MTQIELLKYAYIGALDSYTSAKKVASEGEHAPELETRVANTAADFEEIRNALFKEIEKIAGCPLE